LFKIVDKYNYVGEGYREFKHLKIQEFIRILKIFN